jgi:hypothetical protein
LPSGSPDTVGASDFGYFGAHNFGIPSLHVPLSNASSAASRPPSHGSGSGWFATPFLYDSFIHYFTPVYPDANQAESPMSLTLHFSLDKTKEIVYVLMGEHTQSIGFV